MSNHAPSDRRTFLASLSALAAGALAGCNGDGATADPTAGPTRETEAQGSVLAGGTGAPAATATADGSAGRTETADAAGAEAAETAPGGTDSAPTETAETTASGAESTETPTPEPKGYALLEGFGSGDLGGDTWVRSRTDGVGVAAGRAAFHGSAGVRLDTDSCERVVSGPTMDDPLADYPRPGTTVDLCHRLEGSDFAVNEDSWVYFGLQRYPNADGFDRETYDTGYALRNDALNGSFELRRVDGGEKALDAEVLDSTDHDYDADTWYRIEVDWADSTADIVATLFEVTTDDWTGTAVAGVRSDDDTYLGEGGVVLAAEQGAHFDLLRRTSPP